MTLSSLPSVSRPTIGDPTLDPCVHRVLGVLRQRGIATPITLLPSDPEQARATTLSLGIEPDSRVQSVLLSARGDAGAPLALLVLTPSGRRIDLDRLSALTGLTQLRPCTQAEIASITGYPPGAIAPVGHLRQVTVLIESSLSRYQRVWVPAGHRNAIFHTTYVQLIALTGARPVAVV